MAAPFALAPFTGGGSLGLGLLKGAGLGANILRGASAAAPIIGGIAAGRNQGRQAEGYQRLHQDDTRARMYDTVTRNLLAQAGLGRDKAQFEIDAPKARFQQSVKGAGIANAPDVQGFGGPLFTMSPETRAAASQYAAQGRDRMGKDTFDIPDMPAPPGLQGLPESNWLDKLLGVAGPATAFLGGLQRNGSSGGNGNVNNDLLGNVDFGAGIQARPESNWVDKLVGVDPDMLRRIRSEAQPLRRRASSFIDPASYGGRRNPFAMY